MKQLLYILLMMVLTAGIAVGADKTAPGHPQVAFDTSMGRIVVELFPEQAPQTTRNFFGYVEDGFYDQTVFHRIIAGFMIQGGGFTTEMNRKPTRPPIKNEADNGLSNLRGTIAMARTSDPHSATAQFFINLVDNPHLDFRQKTPQGWGYAVFGKIVAGMSVVDAIAGVKTTAKGPFRNVPQKPVVIRSARRLTVPPPGRNLLNNQQE